MNKHGPFHRLGSPGGAGCAVATLPVEGRDKDGVLVHATLLDAGMESSELELLRTVALGLGVKWGQDQLGWWAAVPVIAASAFAAASKDGVNHALYREDDNGARFLVATFASRGEAEQRAAELAQGGHKQAYFVEPVTAEEAS